ncbi:MAG: lytic murein transglycosylase [Minwuia sp.]|uniref:lytic murein transglycosylase n=1 Tax=Minwuia sp. TaxID=2493630 RepID=UPI003A8B3775
MATVLSLALLSCAPGSTAANAQSDSEQFQVWLGEMRAEAIAEGIRPAIVAEALNGVVLQRRVVKQDRSQAEFKLTYQIYADRLLTPTNIRVGRSLMESEAATLARVAETYQVQPRFIVAIWGMETRYGAVKPTKSVFPSLATLAFDRRRSSFFRKELLQALWMAEKGHIDVGSMTGSWAGAMGQPQFMPSSYMAYARDFDGDGRRDIWNSRADVFASIANYLKSHGWHNDQTWGRRVLLPADQAAFRAAVPANDRERGCSALKSMSGSMGLNDWQALGVRRADGGDLPGRNLEASLVVPDGPDGPAFLVYRNYHSILRYNCAHLYGLAVSTLADALDDR